MFPDKPPSDKQVSGADDANRAQIPAAGPANAGETPVLKRRFVFIANCVYGDHVAGGDGRRLSHAERPGSLSRAGAERPCHRGAAPRPDRRRVRGAARHGCQTSHVGGRPRERRDRAQQQRMLARGRPRRGKPGSQPPSRSTSARAGSGARQPGSRHRSPRPGDGSPGCRDGDAQGRLRPPARS